MGFLMGAQTAAQSATSALQWGAAATGASAIGQLFSGFGEAQQYSFQAQVARNNAGLARASSGEALAAGAVEESAVKLHTGQTIAEQKVAQAANGIDLNVGSPVAARNTTATIGAMDAAMVHYKAAREAYGMELDATNYENQAALYKSAARNSKLSGVNKAGLTLISGASALSDKWASYKLSGAK